MGLFVNFTSIKCNKPSVAGHTIPAKWTPSFEHLASRNKVLSPTAGESPRRQAAEESCSRMILG